mgnify:CR=1 FL=1
MINLSSYDSLQTNIFVKISYPDNTFDYFSDYHKEFTFNSETYTGFGSLLSVAPTENSLRAAPAQIEVVLSGLPTTVIQNALASDLKGSNIEIFRAFFDVETGELLPLGENPAGKFRGIINNFSIENSINMGDDTATVSILLECSSYLEYLENKIGGRRTNPLDQVAYDPTDTSMKRVPTLARSNFDFGAPK